MDTKIISRRLIGGNIVEYKFSSSDLMSHDIIWLSWMVKSCDILHHTKWDPYKIQLRKKGRGK